MKYDNNILKIVQRNAISKNKKDKDMVFEVTNFLDEKVRLNMYNNGYRKIFDCGNQVWKF